MKGTPKVLFWNDLVNEIPTATASTENRSLFWQGENSLPGKSFSRFERFKENTFLIRKTIYLTPADMAVFSFRNKVHIKGVNYLVGSLKASLKTNQKIIPAEVELWKI